MQSSTLFPKIQFSVLMFPPGEDSFWLHGNSASFPRKIQEKQVWSTHLSLCFPEVRFHLLPLNPVMSKLDTIPGKKEEEEDDSGIQAEKRRPRSQDLLPGR